MRCVPRQRWDRTENFSTLSHLLWDLGLIQRLLKKGEEFPVFIVMLRYSDFRTGERVVFIGTFTREAEVEHPTQAQQLQTNIERIMRITVSIPGGDQASECSLRHAPFTHKNACNTIRSMVGSDG